MTDREKDLAREIGFFCKQEGFSKDSFESLDITDITFEGDTVTIILGRPGLIIGKKGSTITKLQQHLSTRFEAYIKINIKEATLKSYLMCAYNIEQYLNEEYL